MSPLVAYLHIDPSAHCFIFFKHPLMVDRILHIGHKFANQYNKELLQRAAEVYIYKGPAAVVPHLVNAEKMEAPEAEALAQKIAAELQKVNQQVLLQYVVILSIFMVLVVAGLVSESYIFAAFFAVPALFFIYSLIKFLRRNKL
jgi:hypothetical protein